MYGFDHLGMGLGGLGMILIWIVPLVLLFLLFGRIYGRKDVRREKTALDILEERYARGAIDKEEFEQKKRDLLA